MENASCNSSAASSATSSSISSSASSASPHKRKRSPPNKENSSPAAGSKGSAASRVEMARKWLAASYIECANSSVPRKQLYDSYTRYCEARGLDYVSNKILGKAVWRMFPGIDVKRLGSRAVSSYHYCGITYRTTEEQERVELLDVERKRRKLAVSDSLESVLNNGGAAAAEGLANAAVEAMEKVGLADISDAEKHSELFALPITPPQLLPAVPVAALAIPVPSDHIHWLHAAHCELVVRCLHASHFRTLEEELTQFWVAGRLPLNCNSFAGEAPSSVFLEAETKAYRDAVASLQGSLEHALPSDTLDAFINLIENLKFMHRNTNCAEENMRGCLGYFIHLLTSHVELAKLTGLVDDVFSDREIASAMSAAWTDSLRDMFDCNHALILVQIYRFGDVLAALHTHATSSLIAFTDALLLSLSDSVPCSTVAQVLQSLFLNIDRKYPHFPQQFLLLRIWFDDYLGMAALRELEF